MTVTKFMAHRQWQLPPIGKILDDSTIEPNKAQAHQQIGIIEKSLAEFGLALQVRNVHYGPRLTQFSLKPRADVQISKITKLEEDLSVALSGALAQIEEPSPGYPYVRVVVENYQTPNVKLRQVIDSAAFHRNKGMLKIGLGLDIFGEPMVIDLAAMPHLLIGGAPGSGKSVCINAIIASLLCTYPPDTLQLLLIDLNYVELKNYSGLPHLVMPVITQSSQVLQIFNEVIRKIDQRYKKLAQLQTRDIAAYNRKASQVGQKKIPHLVIVIENLFDLMMIAPKDLEKTLTRIVQKARSAGIHVILATVRAHVDTVAGSIKANFPGRIALRVVDRTESQLILDMAGAEKLLGQGDMLYRAPNAKFLQRVQGVFVSEDELGRIIGFWQNKT